MGPPRQKQLILVQPSFNFSFNFWRSLVSLSTDNRQACIRVKVISSHIWSSVPTNICPDSKRVVGCREERQQAYQPGHAFFNIQREFKIVKCCCSRPEEGEGGERLAEVILSCSPHSLGMDESPD